MHKHTKLTPTLRREVYHRWYTSGCSFRSLATSYHVDKNIIRMAVRRGRLGDFSVHDSTNYRYRTIEYGLRRLTKTEDRLSRKKKTVRYEKDWPGEMVHGDTKRLPNLVNHSQRGNKRETLFVAIDDCTRYLVADILPDRTMWSSTIFLETVLMRSPYSIECHYSDNGGEYKGAKDHAFVATCLHSGIQQKFTKPRHPWTNGKAERVIRTLMEEWYPKARLAKTPKERRQILYQYVDWYNHKRKHMSLQDRTPVQKMNDLFKSGDNA